MAKFKPEYKYSIGTWVFWISSVYHESDTYDKMGNSYGGSYKIIEQRNVGKIVGFSHFNRSSVWYKIDIGGKVVEVDRTWLQMHGIVGHRKTLETLYGQAKT